jgi:tetratricopeptide (TPR) repeat protein
MKKIIILLLIFISGSKLSAQWAIMTSEADSLVRAGANHIYNVEFDSAEVCFKKVIDKYPNQPAGYFLSAMVDWWKITLFRETDYFHDSFLKKIKKVIEISDELLDENEKDINALFFKAGAMGYRGRFYAEQKEWLNAAQDGSEAFELMLECYKVAPNNHDIMLGTGIYNYFAVAIPERYPITKPMLYFLPKGDKHLGLLQLRASSIHARYASIEAKVVLLQIYYTFEKDTKKAIETAKELFAEYPNNPYFHRYLGRGYIKQGNINKYEEIWREITIRCLDGWNGYDRVTAREALYYVGYALKRKKRIQRCTQIFL